MQNIEFTTEETFEPVDMDLTESLEITPPQPEIAGNNEISGGDFMCLLGVLAIVTTVAGASINFVKDKKS